MAKDPAFLFYPKDWLQGTAEMHPSEKGVYIDLLAHQHQTGDLPSDIKRLARLVGMSLMEFEPIWETLSSKFIANATPNAIANAEPVAIRLVNKKLLEVTKERQDKGRMNTIIGAFGNALRKFEREKKHSKHIKKIREEFNYIDFIDVLDGLSERCSEWISERYQFLEDGDGIKESNKKGIENFQPFSENFKSNWHQWLSYKAAEHSDTFKTIESEQIAFNKLVRISGENEDMAKKIIMESIENHWMGLFKLNKDGTKKANEESRKTLQRYK